MKKNELDSIALSIRSLSIDAIEKANSGHPGLPLGAAELAAVLYGNILKYNAENPNWHDRDRFILSAGHGSMLLYSILHLAGYPVTLDDIKTFRQIGSVCPGHPEYGYTPGVEATSGPLGQGVSMAVGFAIAESILAATYNTQEYEIVNHYTYALVGEGCLMEGVASEACSYAGTLQLGKLIVFYDENKISIDGSTEIAFTEDVEKRYEAYGWQVLRGSMYNYDEIEALVKKAKQDTRPSLIMLKSVIGKGAPTVENSAAAHGAPLGKEGVLAAKKALGLDPSKPFYVAPEAYAAFAEKKQKNAALENSWNTVFEKWSKAYPEKRKAWDQAFTKGGVLAELLEKVEQPSYTIEESIATRAGSKKALNAFAKVLPNLVGGSADLQGPNAVGIDGAKAFSASNRNGRYLHFGVREFGMAAIINGMQLHGGLRAFCATFAVFSDYLRPALRLAALMKIPSIYVFTHDSIFVGEDGPTHQPVETLASLRAIPNTLVLRPADAEETFEAWRIALAHSTGPVCLILSRQNLPILKKEDSNWRKTIECGAYIVQKGSDTPEVCILATGSEVELALRAAALSGKKVRVVSVLSKESFEKTPEELKRKITGTAKIITAEAGVRQGWEGLTESPQNCFSIEQFGESGPAKKVAEHLGFTAEALAKLL
ncbi:transketolase [Treponema phagedenis]|uniref:transketolase n=1 Tax=Treponema phagedenis TaxID=162 RepID=UPI000463C119|nr:transketolase [Treponema phagedenis]NVP24738.1 transketolase [Treponema phagedenis]QKS93048.1 transketolase [Treponema phagedenis]QLC58927.1 transketolase [Treponema phagedenis]